MKELKNLCLLIMLCLLSKVSFAQLVHLELGGAGAIYSVNYDNRFSSKTKLGFRIGLGILPVSGGILFVPAQINYVSRGTQGIEVGVGATGVNSIGQLLNGRKFSGLDDSDWSPTITLAYRFQTKKSQTVRLGFTALTDFGLQFPWSIFMPTLSIGRQF